MKSRVRDARRLDFTVKLYENDAIEVYTHQKGESKNAWLPGCGNEGTGPALRK